MTHELRPCSPVMRATSASETLTAMQQNTTRIARTQWNARTGRSQMTIRRGTLLGVDGEFLEAVVVMAGLARAVRVRDLLLERRQVAGTRDLRQLRGLLRHLVHLAVEVRAVLPDLRLRARMAVVGAFAE